MPMLARLKEYLFSLQKKETEAVEAYDNWALSYDNQPDNLMLALDEALINKIFDATDFTSKIIADIGCGTGRYWKKILDRKPARLLGYDVSERMLDMLTQKYPDAETFLLTNNRLKELKDESCDIVISTLTVAHIKNIEEALHEWARVLKPGGEMIITDFHPDALAKGAKRTFRHNDEPVIIRNYVHSTEKLKRITGQLHLEKLRFSERKINDSVKYYYEKQNAIAVYNKFYGSPIIYCLHLKKAGAVTKP
jgi:ubiquinone/menaquinone biosynthesis C-methylase UbiE